MGIVMQLTWTCIRLRGTRVREFVWIFSRTLLEVEGCDGRHKKLVMVASMFSIKYGKGAYG